MNQPTIYERRLRRVAQLRRLIITGKRGRITLVDTAKVGGPRPHLDIRSDVDYWRNRSSTSKS